MKMLDFLLILRSSLLAPASWFVLPKVKKINGWKDLAYIYNNRVYPFPFHYSPRE